MAKIFPAIIAVVILAGCAAPDPAPAADPAASQSVHPPPPVVVQDPTMPPGEAPPTRLVLEGCSGWVTGVRYPADSGPGASFPGWEPDLWVFSDVLTYGFDCQRLSIGPFERPIRLVYDYHDRMTVPSACAEASEQTTFYILGSLFVNDAEVADYLRASLGLPATVADIQWTASGGPAGTLDWSWGHGHVSLVDHAQDSPKTVPAERMFWQNAQGGVSMMQIHYDVVGQAGVNLVAQGAYESPMLNAGQSVASASPGEAYATPSRISADLQSWPDLECKPSA